MREILFRGKRVDNGEWVYGSLVQAANDTLNSAYISMDDFARYDERIGYYNDNSMRVLSKYFPVVPETVGQFTGLRDKNGKEIYEGDIVLTQEYRDKPYSERAVGKRHTGVVKYKIHEGSGFYNPDTKQSDISKQWGAEWKVVVEDMGKFTCCDWSGFFDCEVIGNIYEHPHLLLEEHHGA